MSAATGSFFRTLAVPLIIALVAAVGAATTSTWRLSGDIRALTAKVSGIKEVVAVRIDALEKFAERTQVDRYTIRDAGRDRRLTDMQIEELRRGIAELQKQRRSALQQKTKVE